MVLIGYWPLNETTGSTAQDHSGKENHGSITGAGPAGTGTISGPTGQSAYSFDGSDDNIDAGDINAIDGVSRITIAAWVRGNTTPSGDNNEMVSIKPGVWNFDWDQTSVGTPTLYLNDGSSWYNTPAVSNNPSKDTWVHLVGTYDGSTIRFYINGVEEASKSASFTLASTTYNVQIGSKSGNTPLNGAISEVRIYNHALTPQEIQYLYTVGKQGRMVTNKKNI